MRASGRAEQTATGVERAKIDGCAETVDTTCPKKVHRLLAEIVFVELSVLVDLILSDYDYKAPEEWPKPIELELRLVSICPYHFAILQLKFMVIPVVNIFLAPRQGIQHLVREMPMQLSRPFQQSSNEIGGWRAVEACFFARTVGFGESGVFSETGKYDLRNKLPVCDVVLVRPIPRMEEEIV